MNTARIVREIEAEIAKLTSARNILTTLNWNSRTKRKSKRASTSRAFYAKRANRLSAAGRRKLSEMMKKRWAERRKKVAARTK
jgi:nuclear transport factor 2 (NTF2) superfamily protein